jgi:hypothetical protein
MEISERNKELHSLIRHYGIEFASYRGEFTRHLFLSHGFIKEINILINKKYKNIPKNFKNLEITSLTFLPFNNENNENNEILINDRFYHLTHVFDKSTKINKVILDNVLPNYSWYSCYALSYIFNNLHLTYLSLEGDYVNENVIMSIFKLNHLKELNLNKATLIIDTIHVPRREIIYEKLFSLPLPPIDVLHIENFIIKKGETIIPLNTDDIKKRVKTVYF